MDTLTPEQNNQIKSWAEERDKILLSIASNRIINEKLEKDINNKSESISDLEKRINYNLGKIEEIEKTEKQFEKRISDELSILINQKTKLESQVENLDKHISIKEDKLNILTESIKTLTILHDRVFDRVGSLDKVVDNVVRVNTENINQINFVVSGLKKALERLYN